MGLIGTVALALAIAAGSMLGSATKETTVEHATNLRHAGVILFAVLYGLIVLTHGYFYLAFDRIMSHRKKVSLRNMSYLDYRK